MDTNTLQIIENIGDKLSGCFNVLAEKAGVAADHFYPIFVRQQMIESVTTLVFISLGLIFTVWLFRMGVGNLKEANCGSENQNITTGKAFVGFSLGAILALVLLMVIGENGTQLFAKILNPEYYAVQSLINMVK